MKVMVIYDGSPDARAALAYGVKKAKASGGELLAYHLLRHAVFHDDEGMLRTNEESLQDSLRRAETVNTLVDRKGCKIRTTIAFTLSKSSLDILRDAAKAEADLIVAPSEFEILLEKACCLVDIVTASRGNFGMYKRPGRRGEAEHPSPGLLAGIRTL